MWYLPSITRCTDTYIHVRHIIWTKTKKAKPSVSYNSHRLLHFIWSKQLYILLIIVLIEAEKRKEGEGGKSISLDVNLIVLYTIGTIRIDFFVVCCCVMSSPTSPFRHLRNGTGFSKEHGIILIPDYENIPPEGMKELGTDALVTHISPPRILTTSLLSFSSFEIYFSIPLRMMAFVFKTSSHSYFL